jgi:arginyl-tRNA synthetase
MKQIALEEKIIALLRKALKENFALPDEDFHPSLDLPKDSQHGDLSCAVCLGIAAQVKKSPLEISRIIKDFLEKQLSKELGDRTIKKIEAAPPGFLNFFIHEDFLRQAVVEIQKEKENFGRAEQKKEKVLLEFVSANPTGSLSVAHARQAAFGDSLARILSFCGYPLSREYYNNDEGRQIEMLGRSIACRYFELIGKGGVFPEDGYKGEYIRDLAKEILAGHKNKLDSLDEKTLKFFSQFGVESLSKMIKKELADFSVHFDNWYSQKALSESGKIENALTELAQKGYLYEQEGALWFKSTEFGDDKDRVIRKSDGALTYITADIAYHQDKFQRGFAKLINIWGPDHHGYIPRLKAAVQALGYKPEKLVILIVQLATLFKQGKQISMSTRQGEYVSLRQVLDEVGPDAARFFFLMRKRDAHLDFDLELAKKHSLENPVYYIQYAYARICAILAQAKDFSPARALIAIDKLTSAEEIDLLRLLNQFPKTVNICANALEPHHLVVYLQRLATCFHRFYDRNRVLNNEDALLTQARLALIDSVRYIFLNGLGLIGVSAPQSM